ncbi:MAG TPA: hypothetical protein PJ995_21560 [Cyclobacteriaceae bacterium]|nr:hypothetical protein [Cyclobacteriaceae bacterium]HMX02939.1 hypothetical protein [Cyclobacteriaceae bacterium]
MSAAAAGAAAKVAGDKISKLLASWGFWAVVFVVGFAAWFYFKGRRKGKEAATAALKEDLKVTVNSKLLTAKDGKAWDPAPITDRLHEDIYGNGFRDNDVYSMLLALPDEKIKAIHNDWMNRYFDVDKETLKKAIDGEWTLFDSAFDEQKDAVLAKMSNIGLK